MNSQELLLLTGYLDGTLNDAQMLQLQTLLRESAEARSTLRTLATIDTKLTELSTASPPVADQMHMEQVQRDISTGRWTTPKRLWLASLAMAGVVLLLLGIQIGNRLGRVALQQVGQIPSIAPLEITDDGVAVLVNAIDVQWLPNRARQLGTILAPGDFELEAGLAELEFYSGVRLIVQGPARLEIVSATQAVCHSGKLRAYVPPPARGFSMTTPRYELVDLGTEFGVEVGVGGDSNVQVFDGEVELYPIGGPRSPEQAKRLFGGAGMSWNSLGEAKAIQSEPSGFSSFDEVRQQSRSQSRQRYAAWQAWNQSLHHDSRVAVRYDFETHGDRLPDSGPQAAHGTIIGCARTSGRWQEKGALEFKRPGDRVRVEIPGSYDTLTLSAWIRVDASPGRHQGLLLTDGFAEGHPHWQISPIGELRLGVRRPNAIQAPRGTNYATPVIFQPQNVGVWSFVATVYDSKAGRVSHFFNERQVVSADMEFPQNLSIGLADIGNWGVPLVPHPQQVRNFVGRMDELTLWKVALDANELRHIYLSTRP